MVEADREAWTQIGTRALTAGEKFRVERMVGKWAREHRWGACMGRAVAILFAGFALFYFGPTYSWWGAGLFLLLALMPLLVASTSAEAARSAPAANVVIIRARCHTVRQPAGKMTVYQPSVGPFAVLVEPAWLRRWPEGQELEVELCPMGSGDNLTGAVVVHLPGVSPPPGTTPRVSVTKRKNA